MDPLTTQQPFDATPLEMPYTITARQVGAYTIVDYTPRAFLVTGDTKPIKEQLKGLGGRFNMFEIHKGTRQYSPAWVYPKTRLAIVEQFLQTGVMPTLDPTYRRLSPYAAPAPTPGVTLPLGQVAYGLPVVIAAAPVEPEISLAEATDRFVTAMISYPRAGPLRHVHPTGAGAEIVLRGSSTDVERLLEAERTLDPTVHIKLRAEINNIVLVLLTRAQPDPQLD